MSKILVYAIIAMIAIASLASLIMLNTYLVIFSVSASLALFFLYKMWDVFEGLIIKRTGIVQVVGNYELAGDRVSAVTKRGSLFCALSAAILNDLPSKGMEREGIERIIASTNAPFRFVLQVEKLNTGKIFDDLRTRRRMKEIELSKTVSRKGTDTSKIIEREIELIESEIRAIGSGAVPLKAEMYIMSFAESESKFVAEEKALSQVKALAGEFSAVLGAGFEVLSGAQLIKTIRSDLFSGGELHAA